MNKLKIGLIVIGGIAIVISNEFMWKLLGIGAMAISSILYDKKVGVERIRNFQIGGRKR